MPDGQHAVFANAVLVKGFSAAFFSNGARILYTFLSIPLFLQFLGDEIYGFWTSILSILQPLVVLDLGVFSVIKNKLVETREQKRFDDFYRYLFAGKKMVRYVFGLFLVLSVVYFILPFSPFFEIPDSLTLYSGKLLIFVGAFIFVWIAALGLSESFFAARMELSFFKKWEGIAYLGSLALLYFLSFTAVSIHVFCLASLFLPSFVKTVLFWVYAAKVKSQPELKQSYNRAQRDPAELGQIIPKSIQMVVANALRLITLAMPVYLIGQYSGYEVATDFSIIFRVINLPITSVVVLIPIFWPIVNLSIERRAHQYLRKKWAQFLIASTLGTALYCVTIYLGYAWITHLWLGEARAFDFWVFVGLLFWAGSLVASLWGECIMNAREYFRTRIYIEFILLSFFLLSLWITTSLLRPVLTFEQLVALSMGANFFLFCFIPYVVLPRQSFIHASTPGSF